MKTISWLVYNKVTEVQEPDIQVTIANIERDSNEFVTMYGDYTEDGICRYMVMNQELINEISTFCVVDSTTAKSLRDAIMNWNEGNIRDLNKEESEIYFAFLKILERQSS